MHYSRTIEGVEKTCSHKAGSKKNNKNIISANPQQVKSDAEEKKLKIYSVTIKSEKNIHQTRRTKKTYG